MKREVRHYGDPVLKQKALPVANVDEAIRSLAQDMLDTMYAEEGIGLAAPQVGESLRLVVVDIPPTGDVDKEGLRCNPDIAMPIVLINPEILEASKETSTYEEGCLSFPEIRANIIRPVTIRARWTTLEGKLRTETLTALVGRCVQHELDHLDGVMICDRMSSVKKIAAKGKLSRLRRETRAALGIVD